VSKQDKQHHQQALPLPSTTCSSLSGRQPLITLIDLLADMQQQLERHAWG